MYIIQIHNGKKWIDLSKTFYDLDECLATKKLWLSNRPLTALRIARRIHLDILGE